VKYTVVWLQSAEDRLAEIWLSTTDREAITRAARQIDVRLRFRPSSQGESRPGNRRVLLAPPLGVKFEVHDEDAVVKVLSVWHFQRR